jgi:hypothetical protein
MFASVLNLKSSCKAITHFDAGNDTLNFDPGPVVYRCAYTRIKEFCGGVKQTVVDTLHKLRDDRMPYIRDLISRDRSCFSVRIAERYRAIVQQVHEKKIHQKLHMSNFRSQLCLRQDDVWFARPMKRQKIPENPEAFDDSVEYREGIKEEEQRGPLACSGDDMISRRQDNYEPTMPNANNTSNKHNLVDLDDAYMSETDAQFRVDCTSSGSHGSIEVWDCANAYLQAEEPEPRKHTNQRGSSSWEGGNAASADSGGVHGNSRARYVSTMNLIVREA